jgi:branched-chain amino acid transport system substrate-binding protein
LEAASADPSNREIIKLSATLDPGHPALARSSRSADTLAAPLKVGQPEILGRQSAPIWRTELRPIRSAAIAGLALVALAGSLTGCQSSSDDQAAGNIVIGVDLELSGGLATLGKTYQRALELKVEHLNESGVLGDRKVRLEVKDNRSDPSESLRNINEFAANPDVQAIVMGSCVECVTASAPAIAEARVPTIALTTANVADPVAEHRYLFKLGPNAADNAAALVNELKRQDVDDVSMLYTDDSYGREGLAAVKAELRKADIAWSGGQAVKPTDTDVSNAVRKLTSQNPDALIIWTTAEQATLATVNVGELGYDGKLFFDAGAADSLFLDSSAADSADGATMVFTQTMVIDDVIANTPAKALRKQWFREYTSRYGGYAGYSSFAADALQLLVDAVVAASGSGQPNRDTVRDVLETLRLDGLSGPIRLTPDNHSGLMPQALSMLVARNGRWRLASS